MANPNPDRTGVGGTTATTNPFREYSRRAEQLVQLLPQDHPHFLTVEPAELDIRNDFGRPRRGENHPSKRELRRQSEHSKPQRAVRQQLLLGPQQRPALAGPSTARGLRGQALESTEEFRSPATRRITNLLPTKAEHSFVVSRDLTTRRMAGPPTAARQFIQPQPSMAETPADLRRPVTPQRRLAVPHPDIGRMSADPSRSRQQQIAPSLSNPSKARPPIMGPAARDNRQAVADDSQHREVIRNQSTLQRLVLPSRGGFYGPHGSMFVMRQPEPEPTSLTDRIVANVLRGRGYPVRPPQIESIASSQFMAPQATSPKKPATPKRATTPAPRRVTSSKRAITPAPRRATSPKRATGIRRATRPRRAPTPTIPTPRRATSPRTATSPKRTTSPRRVTTPTPMPKKMKRKGPHQNTPTSTPHASGITKPDTLKEKARTVGTEEMEYTQQTTPKVPLQRRAMGGGMVPSEYLSPLAQRALQVSRNSTSRETPSQQSAQPVARFSNPSPSPASEYSMVENVHPRTRNASSRERYPQAGPSLHLSGQHPSAGVQEAQPHQSTPSRQPRDRGVGIKGKPRTSVGESSARVKSQGYRTLPSTDKVKDEVFEEETSPGMEECQKAEDQISVARGSVSGFDEQPTELPTRKSNPTTTSTEVTKQRAGPQTRTRQTKSKPRDNNIADYPVATSKTTKEPAKRKRTTADEEVTTPKLTKRPAERKRTIVDEETSTPKTRKGSAESKRKREPSSTTRPKKPNMD